MGSTFGRLFRVSTWGESHGPALGCAIDGCPPGIPLRQDDIQAALDRRRPGQGDLASSRAEPDRVEILSGVFQGLTLGTPIALLIRNADANPLDYQDVETIYRPGHADFTYRQKYGVVDHRGGGRASGRETVARVAAGAVAEKFLQTFHDVEIVAWVDQVGSLVARVDPDAVSRSVVDSSPIRCPDPAVASSMEELARSVASAGDSIGGCIRGLARKVPVGWGDPVFDKLEATLAQAMMSIPACRGFEVGDGFAAATMRASEHNDRFVATAGRVVTATNHCGGVLGGISTGGNIAFRAAFKPVPSISLSQETVDWSGDAVRLSLTGRHDACLLPRAVPVVEAMCALVLADAALVQGSVGH